MYDDNMKKVILVLRCAFEGLLGFIMVLGAIVQLPKFIGELRSESFSGAYTAGVAFGLVMLLVLGFFLCRDALRVGRRIRTTQVTQI